MRSLKLKVVTYCIINKNLFWKDSGGILLNYIDEDEAQRIMVEFHRGACKGNHCWKDATYKILRFGYYWPTLFSDVNAKVRVCMECQMFERRKTLLPFPLKPITIEVHFQ